jgi:hypothetical protein
MVKRRDMTSRMAGVGSPAEATPHVSLFPDVKLPVLGDSPPHEILSSCSHTTLAPNMCIRVV